MTLEQLRIFIALAEREQLARALEALNLPRSEVSSAITALEECYGVKLFDRDGHRIMLTEAGRTFLPEARAVLARVAVAEQVLADAAGLARGRLRLAASHNLGNYWLPQLMLSFRRLYPGVSLELSIGTVDQVAEWVAGMHADLGFAEGVVTDPRLHPEQIGSDRLELVVTPEHPWARAGRVPRDLRGTRWVLRAQGPETLAEAARALGALGCDISTLPQMALLETDEAVLEAVLNRGAATVQSQLVTASEVATGRLVVLPVPGKPRPLWLLRHSGRQVTRAEATFSYMARQRGESENMGAGAL